MAECSATCAAEATEVGSCVAHVSAEELSALTGQPADGGPIVGRRATIDGRRAAALLTARRGVDLTGATITSTVYLMEENVGEVRLGQARFEEALHLDRARLSSRAEFGGSDVLCRLVVPGCGFRRRGELRWRELPWLDRV